MSSSNRPLSPHLQVYRWRAHMLVSILHRATGFALAVGMVGLVWWLVAIASGADYFNQVNELAGSIIGQIVLFGLTLAFVQHLASGIRHLFMDAGKLYDLPINTLTARMTFIFSVVATLMIWGGTGLLLGGS